MSPRLGPPGGERTGRALIALRAQVARSIVDAEMAADASQAVTMARNFNQLLESEQRQSRSRRRDRSNASGKTLWPLHSLQVPLQHRTD